MEGNLVIVESPAKARTIQKFLGKDFTVKSSQGHIRDLHDNSLSIDVANGFKPEYVVPKDKKRMVAELKAAADKAQTVKKNATPAKAKATEVKKEVAPKATVTDVMPTPTAVAIVPKMTTAVATTPKSKAIAVAV